MTSREEELLQAIINGDDVSGWKCRSRVEEYLLKCCCGETCDGMKPKTRIEALLKQLADKMAGGGSGGGGSSGTTPVDNGLIYEGKYRVRYFDTDGTILKIEYVENGGKTTPPNSPNYDPDYLIFDEWNYDVENYIVEQPTDIGAVYKTVDDATYMFCKFTSGTGLNPTLKISGFTSIDWGDGTVDTSATHTYQKEGNYIIKISGNFNFITGMNVELFGDVDGTCLIKMFIKKGVLLYQYALRYCSSLNILTIPKGNTIIPTYCLNGCRSLKTIILPKEITEISAMGIYEDYSLETIVMSQELLKTNQGFCYKCHSLKNAILPFKVQRLGSDNFYTCYSLKEFIIPKSITSLSGKLLYQCFALITCIILSKPSLDSSSFTGNNKTLTMWIDDNNIEELKVATNWANYASYMKLLSEYNRGFLI